jgi:DNA-binding transcriptional MerR regulator
MMDDDSTLPLFRIGQAAQMSGVNQANIRFYEEKKLISAQARSASSYRLYSKRDVHTLRFIRLCRSMDMSLDEVSTLLGLGISNKADCTVAAITLDAHLDHVRERLAELQALERELLALRACCDGSGSICRLVEALHQRADQGNLAPVTGPATRHL